MKKHSDHDPDPESPGQTTTIHHGPKLTETLNNQNVQKVKKFDQERAIAIRAARSFRQAREKWIKMNREYPATIDDHIALERLLAAERGISNALFIEEALIIGFDPAIFRIQSCNAPILPHYLLNLQQKFRIILAPTKVPLNLRDGELILEKQKKADREAEEFQKELDKFQERWLGDKMDGSEDQPDGKERD